MNAATAQRSMAFLSQSPPTGADLPERGVGHPTGKDAKQAQCGMTRRPGTRCAKAEGGRAVGEDGGGPVGSPCIWPKPGRQRLRVRQDGSHIPQGTADPILDGVTWEGRKNSLNSLVDLEPKIPSRKTVKTFTLSG